MSEIDERQKRLNQARKDFEVHYRFFSSEEGGRQTGPPSQPYRSDWIYDGDDISAGLYMIWPAFLDSSGEIIEIETIVPVEGTAQMMIINDDLRATFHAGRLKPGVKGYFMEGPHRVAEATVTKLLAISDLASRTVDDN